MSPLKKWIVVGCLALPLVGMGAVIAINEARLQTATTCRVKVEGYDPRDLLRGRYVRLRIEAEEMQGCLSSIPAAYRKAFAVGSTHHYFMAEDEAPAMEKILRENQHRITMGIRVPGTGSPILGDLYVDEMPWRDWVIENDLP